MPDFGWNPIALKELLGWMLPCSFPWATQYPPGLLMADGHFDCASRNCRRGVRRRKWEDLERSSSFLNHSPPLRGSFGRQAMSDCCVRSQNRKRKRAESCFESRRYLRDSQRCCCIGQPTTIFATGWALRVRWRSRVQMQTCYDPVLACSPRVYVHLHWNWNEFIVSKVVWKCTVVKMR